MMNPYGIIPENLDVARINQLISDQVMEGRWIEYKTILPSGTDADKKEFLADVSSFANAGGGLIFYGISEKQKDGKNTGLPEAALGLGSINLDQIRLGLENLIRDCLDPRIIGIRIEQVKLSADNYILVIFIPRSWNGPHAVTFGGLMRFYSRNSGGKSLLNVSEVRTAFLNQSNLGEQLKRFSLERAALIVANEIPVTLEDEPKVIVHLQPLDRGHFIDLQRLSKDYPSLRLLYLSDLPPSTGTSGS